MELIGIGDLHFDKLDPIIPDASELICASVEKVFRYALKKGVRHVVFYGDICERPRMSYHSQVLFYRTLLKAEYSDLVFHVILGNHDFAEDGTHSLQVLETVCESIGRPIHVYTKATRTILDGVPFNFLPHPYTETSKNAVNVGHFEVAGSLRDNGRKIEEGHSKNHVTLMGHLHTNHRVRNTHYSGTLYQTNFGEVEGKFFHHVTATGPSPSEVEVNNVKFTSPWRLVNLIVDTPEVLDTMETDHRVLYKLFMKDGVDVDLNSVLTKYPNVVRHNTFKSKKDLEVMVSQAWEFDSDIIEDVVNEDEEVMVTQFLKAEGFKKKQVKQGLQILHRVKGTTKVKA